MARNQKIEAIKLARQNFPVGLKEAKDAVDEVEAGRRNSLADLGSAAPDASFVNPVNQSAPKRPYAALVAVVIGMALFMFGAVVIFLFMQPAPAPDVPTGAPTPTFVPTPQFAALVSTLGAEGLGAGKFTQANSMALDGAAPIDDVDNIAIDRQDNLFLQDTTKVTRYALTGK